MLSRTFAGALRCRLPPSQVGLTSLQHRSFFLAPRKLDKQQSPGSKIRDSIGRATSQDTPHHTLGNIRDTVGKAELSKAPIESQNRRVKDSGSPSIKSASRDSSGETLRSEISSKLPLGTAPSPAGAIGSKQAGPSSVDDSSLEEEPSTSRSADPKNNAQDTSAAINSTAAKSPNETSGQIPLPDLTKGIPSTIDAELAAAASATADGSGDGNPSGGDRGEKQLPASAYITSTERRRNMWLGWAFRGVLLALLISPIYLGRDWESQEEADQHPDAPSGFGVSLWFYRAKARLFDTVEYYNAPAYPRLPDPDPLWARPYTLVLSLEDLLVHSEWSQKHGWRTAKRPGVDYFLRYLSQYYELVIFTSTPISLADPIYRKLDPYRIIQWTLYREATLYQNGEYIKDLSRINRDLSKVVLIDTKSTHAQLQPENAIILPKWTGDSKDRDLVALIPLLEYMAAMGVPDTRAVLKSFHGRPAAAEFAAREARLRQQFAADGARRSRRSGGGVLAGALGMGSDGVGGPAAGLGAGSESGKMLLDQIRERGQQQYEILDREIRTNGEKFLQELADEEEKARNEQMKQGYLGFLAGPPKPVEASAGAAAEK